MTVTSLTRIRRFRATHRYWRDEWTAERNREVFGPQCDPHEHEYRLEVEVTGIPDPGTGFIVSLVALDERLDALLAPLAGRDLNEAIPEVSEGEMLPSTEALSDWFWKRLVGTIPDGASLRAVRVWESDDLGAEVTRDVRGASTGGRSDE